MSATFRRASRLPSWSAATINRESDIPSELGAANIAAIKRAMLGYITKPTTLYVSVIGADADIKTGFQALAVHSYDYLVGPVDIASADATALAAQVKAQRTKRYVGKVILPNVAADDEGVINFVSSGIKVGEGTFTAAQYAGRIASVLAGTPAYCSATYAALPEVTGVDTLYALNKNKITMKMDLSKAKSELKAAEKQFDLTHSAADGLKLELAQANYDNMVRNLKAVTSAARETEKAISKAENSADSGGGGTSFGKSVINALAVSGIGDAAKQILSQGANAIAGSALGDDGGSMFSSALSTAATGASAGFMVGGPAGAAIGAAIGTGVGLVSGGIQIFEKRDDAYKDWYAGLYENAGATTDTGLSSGSTIAGSREQTQMAFAQKLGGDEAANAYLDRVKAMATSTNYSYDEITGYSKLLLNTYDAEKTLGVLQTLSDASAGLNLGSSDVKMFISGLSRMRTSGKATTEYLNYFSERGVDVYQALANSTGKDKSKIPEMVTKGKISGADAAEAILTYINETYGGLSDKLATSYDALTDNLSDVQADIDSAMGEGYNEERSKSIAAQIESYGGELGDALQEANKAIGAGRAALENLADQYTEEALSAVLTGKETALDWSDGNAERLQELAGLYQQAMEDYNNGNTQAGTLVETYAKDDCCTHDGHVWRSGQDNNVWAPGTAGAKWNDLGEIEEVMEAG